ncbi:MAG: hypothetical protein O6952_04715, partial [Planctomycetota bacterium]|nr:hypothetical protein [Planctomycetota bacterium]
VAASVIFFHASPVAFAHGPDDIAILRGDSNADDLVDVSDAVHLLTYLFLGGDSPRCFEVADANRDDAIDIGDPVTVLVALFLGGGPLEALSHAEKDSCLGRISELSFSSIQEKIFATGCLTSFCHAVDGNKGQLILETADLSYEMLVGAEPYNLQAKAAGLLLVDPGRPENSFLLKKLIGPDLGEGNRMPLAAQALSDAKITALREWISAGAPREGTIPGVPDITDEDPPAPSPLEPPPVPENGLQIHLVPFQIAARREREIFKVVDPGWTEDKIVTRIDVHMTEASHHFILYTWNNTNSPPPPGHREATSTTGVGASNRTFISGSQQSFYSQTFAPGTGLFFKRGTLFDLNSHYLNLNGTTPLMGEVYVNLFFAEDGEEIIRAENLLIGTFNIAVPPNSTRKVSSWWPSSGGVSRETHVHAVSSHMHRHGEFFQVTYFKKDGSQEVIYDSDDWDEPRYLSFNPPIVLQRGEKFRYECTHTNDDTNRTLRFGLTSEDEMCFVLLLITKP